MWIKKCFLCVVCLALYGQESPQISPNHSNIESLYIMPYENNEALKSLLTYIKNAKKIDIGNVLLIGVTRLLRLTYNIFFPKKYF